jgi:hypothetical protein
VSAGDGVTALLLGVLALAGAFFVVRPELWSRVWFAEIDPRPLALMRIAFGAVVLWTFLGLAGNARLFWSDEGMWLPDMARAEFGGSLRHLWDPEHGFEHWWSPLLLPYGKLTILHYGSPPWLVLTLYAALLASLALMILGAWTRWTTLAAWVLLLQLTRYQTMYYSGADRVIQDFLFLGLLSRWGDAYSVDGWRRGGAPRPIPAWPVRLMMLQLVLIYCATGLAKTGPAWAEGEALYYALNLDHFYRVPAPGLVGRLQEIGVLPALTHAVRWWEMLFPLALLGVALRGYEADRDAGRWLEAPTVRRRLSWLIAAVAGALGVIALGMVTAPERPLSRAVPAAAVILVAIGAYPLVRRAWPAGCRVLLDRVLGLRLWLGFGVLLHLGINLGVNVGTFAEVMVALYAAWLPGLDKAGRNP